MSEKKEGPENENIAWANKKEEEAKQRAKRVKKILSRIDKKLERMKNEPSSGKEESPSQEKERIVWPEMHSLIEKNKEGQVDVSNPDLINLVKKLTNPVNKHLINSKDYLIKELGEGADKFGPDNKDWLLVAGGISKKLDELNETELKEKEKQIGYSRRGTIATEKIRDSHKKVEKISKLPNKKEEQRKILIPMVETIEINNSSLTDPRNAEALSAIDPLLEKGNLDENLKRECIARLRLHHSAVIAQGIPPRETKEYLVDKLGNPESQRWLLQGEDFDFLFKKAPPELNVRKAFEYLELVSTSGLKVKARDGGFDLKTLMDKDISSRERDIIDIFLGDKLRKIIKKDFEKEKRKIDDKGLEKAVKKSLQLAQRMAKATFESSAWNINQIENDPLAEALYFRKFREGKAGTVKDRGPELTLYRIYGFGATFFRDAKTFDREELFLNEEGRQEIGNDYVDETRINRLLKRNRGRGRIINRREVQPLSEHIDEMAFGKLGKNAYLVWLMSSLPTYLNVKELLLKTAWKPDDFDSDTIEGWIKPFKVADPEGSLDLKIEFIAGIFHSVFLNYRRAAKLKWDDPILKGVIADLMESYTSGKEKIAFMNEDEYRFINKYLRDFGVNLHHQAALAGTLLHERKFFGN